MADDCVVRSDSEMGEEKSTHQVIKTLLVHCTVK